MQTYKRNSKKEIEAKGFVYAATTTNNKLNSKFRKEQLGSINIQKIATKDYCYDLYCEKCNVPKVKEIFK